MDRRDGGRGALRVEEEGDERKTERRERSQKRESFEKERTKKRENRNITGGGVSKTTT
jgi:hypothetical protein